MSTAAKPYETRDDILPAITMNVASAIQSTIADGDIIALDTSADWTIKAAIDSAAPFGYVKKVNRDGVPTDMNSTSAPSLTAQIVLIGRHQVKAYSTAAAATIGHSVNSVAGQPTRVVDTAAVATYGQPVILNAIASSGTVYVAQ